MSRFLYRLYRWHTSVRYWTERRFSPAGRVVVGALALAAIAGPDVENNVAYQAFALLSCILGLAFLWSWVFRGRFEVRRLLPRFGTVGQPMRYVASLKASGGRRQRGLVLMENLTDSRPSYGEWKALRRLEARRMYSFRITRGGRAHFPPRHVPGESLVPDVPGGGNVEVPMEVTPWRRGVLRFEGMTVARTDPFGLFRSFRRVKAPQSVLVLPKRYLLPDIQLPGSMRYQQGGVALASHVGRSDEFIGLRDYRRGDPLRHIHWRSWARVGKPVVREFEDEFFVRHALVLDTFTPNPLSQAFEEAVSLAASFACTVRTQESLLDLLFVGAESYCFTAGRGLAHTDQLLEILASVRASQDKPFRFLRDLVLKHAGQVSGIVCIFLNWNKNQQDLVHEIHLLGVPVMVFVILEHEPRKPLELGPMSVCPDRFHVLHVGGVEEALSKL